MDYLESVKAIAINFWNGSDRLSFHSSPNVSKSAFLSTTNRRVSEQGINVPATASLTITRSTLFVISSSSKQKISSGKPYLVKSIKFL